MIYKTAQNGDMWDKDRDFLSNYFFSFVSFLDRHVKQVGNAR